MAETIDLNERWKFDVLGIYDHRCSGGGLDPFYEFLRDKALSLEGDVVEIGVFRGRSLLSTALMLKRMGSSKRVWGFDSFEGFPGTDPQDDFSCFKDLWSEGVIDDEHWRRIKENAELLKLAGRSTDPLKSSSSGSFSDTSEELVRDRALALHVDSTVVLVSGPVENTLSIDYKGPQPESICLALLDSDLYSSYKIALPFLWDRMPRGGMIFLDEYYSLKFPGPRIATNAFCQKVNVKPTLLIEEDGWQRWALFRD